MPCGRNRRRRKIAKHKRDKRRRGDRTQQRLNNARNQQVVPKNTVDQREPERVERCSKERPAALAPRAIRPSFCPVVVPLRVNDWNVKKRRLTKRHDVDDPHQKTDDEDQDKIV